MPRTLLLAACAALSLTVSQADAQPPPPTPAFITAAAQTDAFERREGRLAANRSRDARVRRFGQMMVSDHTRTTQALKAALRRAHLVIPPGPPISADQSHLMEQLSALHGRDFDHAYIDQRIHAHEQALAVMQGYAASGDNPILRQAAAHTVPIIQRHLAMARELAARP